VEWWLGGEVFPSRYRFCLSGIGELDRELEIEVELAADKDKHLELIINTSERKKGISHETA
jgi:hypothetical protein